MADRYQDRAYGPGRGGDQYGSDRGESDPLAELARLIGQTDPFGKSAGQAQQRPAAPRQEARPQDTRQRDPHHQKDLRQNDLRQNDLRQKDLRQDDYGEEDYAQHQPGPSAAPAGPPVWMQRANIRRDAPREAARDVQREAPRETPRAQPPEPDPEGDDYLSAVHPLHRYTPPQPQVPPPQPDHYYDEPQGLRPQAYPQSNYQQQTYQQQTYQQDAYQHDPQAYREAEQELDPSRYDDALFGQIENGVQDFQREPAYPDDPYAYQGEYEDEEEPRKRRGLPAKVAAVLALGVFGVAAAYGYHTYFGTTRSGDIPIIKADNSPTKVVPQQSEAGAKLPDRMVSGDGAERMVPREEQPVDINSRNVGPRVVFPNLNQNANPPPIGSVATNAMPPAPPAGAGPAPAANNGTLPNGEPRKIKTVSVKSDQPDSSAIPATAPPAAAPPAAKNARLPKGAPTQANASANSPISLSPQGQPVDSGTQVAATNPAQIAPGAPASGGGYMIQISSQRSEADAQTSFRALQSKFPSVLGSQTPVIRRVDLGEKGTVYRAMVGPFGSQEEADQFCTSYRTAGGQCLRVKN